MATISAYQEKLTDEQIREYHPIISVRRGGDDDIPFIMRRSLADLRYADLFRQVPDTQFYHYCHKLLEHHCWDGKVLVAHPEGEPDNILGFLIYRDTKIGKVIIYAYTRKDKGGPNFRRQGILSKLLERADVQADTKLTYALRTAMFRFSPSFRDRVDRDRLITHNVCLLFTLLDSGWESRKPGA